METRDIRLIFNYTTRIAKSYNLRPEITKSKGISINSIPALLDQLKSQEENTADAEHLDYMKTSLSIYSLPLFTVPDILEGKHKTSTSTTEEEEQIEEATTTIDETIDDNNQTEAISEEQKVETEETEEVDEKKSKKKDKKNKKEKKEKKEKKDKSIDNDKPKGITKLEKMKEKLHKKK